MMYYNFLSPKCAQLDLLLYTICVAVSWLKENVFLWKCLKMRSQTE